MKFLTTLFTTLAVASLTLAIPANKTSLGLAHPPSSLPASSQQVTTEELSAALPNTLSKECTAALITLAFSKDFAACIPPAAVVQLIPLITDPDKLKKVLDDPANFYKPIAEQPLIKFADGFCLKQCSTQTINGAIKVVSDQCKAELGAKDPLIGALFDAFVLYFPLQTSICFKNGKVYCFDETILTLISLPPSSFPPVAKNPVLDAAIVADPDKICTTCNQEIITTIFSFIDKHGQEEPTKDVLASLGLTDQAYGQAKFGVAVKCGQAFEAPKSK